MEDITKSQEIDQAYFWHLVNKNRKSCNSNNVHPIKANDKTVLTNPDEIRKEWKEYFKN